MYWGDTRGRAKRAGKESEGIVERVRERKTRKVTTAWRGEGRWKELCRNWEKERVASRSQERKRFARERKNGD